MRFSKWVPVVLILVCAASTSAKDEVKDKQPLSALDVRASLRSVSEEVAKRGQPPEFGGIEDRLVVVWRRHAQKRIKEVCAALKVLQQERRFVVEPETGAFLQVSPSGWKGVVSQFTKAYSALATARGGFSKVNTSAESTIVRWDKANKPPDLKQRTVSEVEAARLGYEISAYHARGYRAPTSLVLSHERSVALAAQERRLLRARYDEWQRSRKQTLHGFRELGKETGREAQRQREEYTQILKQLQKACAALMLSDETELGRQVAEYREDPILKRQAKALVAKLSGGRRKVLHYDAGKSSSWSSLVRQGWLLHRNKLRSAVRSARARAKAAAMKADAGGDDK